MTDWIVKTPFGNILSDVPSERGDFEAYARCAKAFAQGYWVKGLDVPAFSLDQAKSMPEWQRVSDGER